MAKENREYKSSVFTMLLEDKNRALDVYNALNGTSYENADELELRVLENALYLSIRNDASFILEATLNLYEHQSTYNPNMPLRDLLYVSNILADLVKDENLYGKRLVRIPVPQFVVFYNGVEEQPERLEMKLSDAYKIYAENPQLELKCTMINLNKGSNPEFMSRCKTMREYMIFVDKVRFYNQTLLLEHAIDAAIDECIEEHVLEEFLKSQKVQVKSMSVLEFDYEKQLKFAIEEGREEGREIGREEGREMGRKEGREMGRKEGRNLSLISIICKKIIKGKPVEVIADELEEEVEWVSRVCEVAKKFAPEYDVNKIYEELQSQVA